MPYFEGAHHFVVNGGSFYEGTRGLEQLQRYAASAASYDSGERYPAPRCHPGTRETIIAQIMNWIEDQTKTSRILWLYGPAGAGKSAIAQTIAQICDERKLLAASFFFSRTAPERNHANPLFPTLAFQLAVSTPAIAARIQDAMAHDPSIPTKTIEFQLKKLLLEPFLQTGPHPLSKVIIVDGLDECQDPEMQCKIIELVALALSQHAQFPFIFLSRPQPEIRDEFNSHLYNSLVHQLSLIREIGGTDNDEDIRLYLKDGLSKICQSAKHRHTMSHLIDKWPSDYDIDRLLWKSSGQFIYASTVLKFVDDPNFNPEDRLHTALWLSAEKDTGVSAEIDRLYIEILSKCVNRERTIQVLRFLICALQDAKATLPNLDVIEQVLSLSPGDAFLALRGLYSVLDVPETPNAIGITFSFHHASFIDFLTDKKRSGVYFIERTEAHAKLTTRCLAILSSPPVSKPFRTYYGWFYALTYWCEHWQHSVDLTCEYYTTLLDFNVSDRWVEMAFIHSEEQKRNLPILWEDYDSMMALFVHGKPLGVLCLKVLENVLHKLHFQWDKNWEKDRMRVMNRYSRCFDNMFVNLLGQTHDISRAISICTYFVPSQRRLPRNANTLFDDPCFQLDGFDTAFEPLKIIMQFSNPAQCGMPTFFFEFLADPGRSRSYTPSKDCRTNTSLYIISKARTIWDTRDENLLRDFNECWSYNLERSSPSEELFLCIQENIDILIEIGDRENCRAPQYPITSSEWISSSFTMKIWLRKYPNAPEDMVERWDQWIELRFGIRPRKLRTATSKPPQASFWGWLLGR